MEPINREAIPGGVLPDNVRSFDMASEISLENGYKKGDLVVWKDSIVYEFLGEEDEMAVIGISKGSTALDDLDESIGSGIRKVPFQEISAVKTLVDMKKANEPEGKMDKSELISLM